LDVAFIIVVIVGLVLALLQALLPKRLNWSDFLRKKEMRLLPKRLNWSEFLNRQLFAVHQGINKKSQTSS
jgi:hypothetical protein